MQKWEFCAVTGIGEYEGTLSPYAPCVWMFTRYGLRTTPVEPAEGDDVARKIAHLGEVGWELVGTGSTSQGGYTTLYFKRPRE